jgi:glycerophosphoryl diester phosphodiesterase
MALERWIPKVAIAHRGSRELWPENTMDAFSEAVALGFRHLETDLRLTADGVLVCIHDSTVDRTTEDTGPVSRFRHADLARLDAGYRHAGSGGHDFRGRGVKVPTLEEAVLSFPDAAFIVDLKEEAVIEPLARLIHRLDLHDRLIVGSFSDARITAFRAASRGRVATSTGSAASRNWLMASRLGRGVPGAASALQLPRRSRGVRVIDRRLVEAAHLRGLQVHVWTINDPVEMAELLDLGVDGLITDRPDLLKQVLEARGEWLGGRT